MHRDASSLAKVVRTISGEPQAILASSEGRVFGCGPDLFGAPMDIAGGLYRELCETPAWDAVFGSGGRAAAALAGVAPHVRLHTYSDTGTASAKAVEALRQSGVEVEVLPRSSDVVFSYLHPLSDPHVAPALQEMPLAEPLRVSADAVLRFGFLEGDAIVDARRAVFDPQTARHAASFRANGSKADQLALVLNEGELRALGADGELPVAARRAMALESADVLIVKRGVRGALVFDGPSDPVAVAAYRSPKVFKIGTGDVYSAWFAHLWAEAGASAFEAATRASRAVAAYAGSRTLPPPPAELSPLRLAGHPGRVRLLGEPDTLGRRFVLEEARYLLRGMGLVVDSPGLDGTEAASMMEDATLIVAEALDDEVLERSIMGTAKERLIVLDEAGRLSSSIGVSCTVTEDFTTAVYQVAWAALQVPRYG